MDWVGWNFGHGTVISKTSNSQGGGWGKLKKLDSQIVFWVVVTGDFWTDACIWCFLSSGWVCRGGSLSRDLLLWNMFVLIFVWRSCSQGLNLSSPPSVSDSPSQLEAFWTLSLISLGRLEHFRLFVLYIGFNVHQNLGDAGNTNK